MLSNKDNGLMRPARASHLDILREGTERVAIRPHKHALSPFQRLLACFRGKSGRYFAQNKTQGGHPMQYQSTGENVMFNMQMTGARISLLRRQMRLTQAEPAEKLDISYQAVSAWERGASMPDIGKLVDLARTLDTTVDFLLSGEGAPQTAETPVAKAFAPETAKIPEPAPASVPAAEEKTVHQHISISVEGTADFATLTALAPFADQKTLDELALEMENLDLSRLHALAPFLSTETLEALVNRSEISGNLSMLAGLAPFLSSATINRLISNSRAKRADLPMAPASKQAAFSGGAVADVDPGPADEGQPERQKHHPQDHSL